MKLGTNDQNNHQVPWNKCNLIGQKSPLKLKEIWAIRIRGQLEEWSTSNSAQETEIKLQ